MKDAVIVSHHGFREFRSIRPGEDWIGACVELLEVDIDGQKQDLTRELHRRGYGTFSPSVEMELRSRDDGFELVVFSLYQGAPQNETGFVFDWDNAILIRGERGDASE